jgi:hypothetical protein
MKPETQATMLEIYGREMLSFLQYVSQATPYAGVGDRPVLTRIQELARSEAADLQQVADFLDRHHVMLPRPGAFPTSFTNYNFVAVRSLLPGIMADEARGLKAMEGDMARLPAGAERELVEQLAAAKRMRVNELDKLTK